MVKTRRLILQYIEYCVEEPLREDVVKTYYADLCEFENYMSAKKVKDKFAPESIEQYILYTQTRFPRTQRKIESLKLFCAYLETNKLIKSNPFHYIQNSELELIPESAIKKILSLVRTQETKTAYQEKRRIRDVAILELLFDVRIGMKGVRLLKQSQIDLENGLIQEDFTTIELPSQTVKVLKRYQILFSRELEFSKWFFTNRRRDGMSVESICGIVEKYARLVGVTGKITLSRIQKSLTELEGSAGEDHL